MSVGKMAATAAGVGRLEEEALRRKERLKALREKTGRKDKEDGEPKTKQLREGEEEGEKHRELRLRNYVPEDEDLKKRRVPQAKPIAAGDPGTKRSTDASWLEVLAPSTLAGCRLLALLHPRIAFVLRNPSPSSRAAFAGSSPLVEEKVKEQLEAAKPEPIIEEVDLANLAPRKPDWDLKRDVAKKLEKLEKRTQRAIAELIRPGRGPHQGRPLTHVLQQEKVLGQRPPRRADWRAPRGEWRGAGGGPRAPGPGVWSHRPWPLS
ncbi:coiled-coil domain-containing protein 12 isoform X1 [Orcinus orca]|uniref:coiled-coil domain-containing protein 12 isoform X1 n=1 Tax=Orcinus orca TaxID=9733 RepID=UPI00144125F3|nr:coiled-coil domain-containing protein 12 isoform X1 [Orcinus orca]